MPRNEFSQYGGPQVIMSQVQLPSKFMLVFLFNLKSDHMKKEHMLEDPLWKEGILVNNTS